MRDLAPITRRFITAVRRRLALVRLLESIAICAAISIAFGLILLFVQIMRGQSGVQVSEAIVVLGLLTGAALGIARRPTAMQAALEADRQLNLDDLLTTVLSLDLARLADFPSGLSLRVEDSRHVPPSEDWRNTIAAYSDSRCTSLRPGQVIVNRMGLRAFAGVGILAGLLFSLSFLTATPSHVDAASSPTRESANLFNSQNSPDAQASKAFSENERMGRPPGSGGVDVQPERKSELEQTSSLDDRTAAKQSTGADAGTGSDAKSPGTGQGAARSANRITDNDPLALSRSEESSEKRSDLSASGNRIALGETPVAGTSSTGIVTGSNATQSPVPPWNTATWKSNADAADRAIRSGNVSQEDADLVQDYFRRD